MRNPLQDQLLKAGLVKKTKVAQVVHEQAQQRKAKHKGKPVPAADSQPQIDAASIQAQRAERDRQLAAERNAQAKERELQAQIRQIIEHHKLPREGDSDYRFSDGNSIRGLLVDSAQRAQLASGALVVVRAGDGYELLPREAADKVIARDAGVVVVDHANATPSTRDESDDEFYSQFQVPDDLVW